MKLKTLAFGLVSTLFFMASCDKDKKTTTTNDSTTYETVAPTLGDVTFVFDYKGILVEFTSTGCPGCGSWGKPTFYSLASQNEDKVIPMAAHIKYGDPMISGVSEFFASNRTGSKYTPQIWVNDETIMVLAGGGINSAASISKAGDLIKNMSATTSVGLGSIMKIQDGKAYVKYGVKLKSDFAAGDYFMNTYLMEDGIVAQQASYANNPATHNFVIRQAANGPWGNQITKKAGEELEATWEHTFTENIKEGQYLVNILWKKVGNIYIPVNAVKVSN